MKARELWLAYRKVTEANSQCGAKPQTCCSYKDLYAVLGGDPPPPHTARATYEKPELQASSLNSNNEEEVEVEEDEKDREHATGGPAMP